MVQQTNKTMTSGFMDPDSSYSHVIVNVKLRHLQSRNDNCHKKDAVQEGEESVTEHGNRPNSTKLTKVFISANSICLHWDLIL